MVVLSMITKNTIERLGVKLFQKVLKSSLQVPYTSIILVDDSTSNETAKIARMFAQKQGKEIIIERSKFYGYSITTRATARQTAIDIFFENYN
ncbi:MAG: glycosyl transferase, partial [Candidatus Bathyarchaeia archaeon]